MSFTLLGILNSQAAAALPTPPVSTGLQAWYDPSYTASLTFSGSNVTQINDLSGNDRHAVQATSTNQPTTTTWPNNSLTALSFDGTDWMEPSADWSQSNLQIFCVLYNNYSPKVTYMGWRASSPTATNYVMWGETGGSTTTGAPTKWISRENDGTTGIATMQTSAQTQYGLRTIYCELDWAYSIAKFRKSVTTTVGAIVEFDVDSTDASTTFPTGRPVIGCRADFAIPQQGQIGEILIYDGSLTSGDKTTIKNYFINKWGV